jgi:signal transduction histidine kinase
MNTISKRVGLYLAINLIVLLVSFLHLPEVFDRPKAPFHLISTTRGQSIDKIYNQTACGELRTGDRVYTWDTHTLNLPDVTEFLAEMSKIGNPVTITFQRDREIRTTTITLIPFHPSYRYVFIIFFVGFITWCLAIFVLLKGPPVLSTTVLHWTLASFGFAIMLTTGAVDRQQIFPYLNRSLFLIFYMATVSSLFYFSTIFPKPKPGSAILKSILIFIPATVFTLFMVFYHLRAIYLYSVNEYARFQFFFNIFHISLYVFVGVSLVNFFHSYYTSQQIEDRQRLRLICWGILLGATPFLLFSILPQILGRSELIREEFTLIFFLLIPFTFTLAILKYRLLNIEVIINRTLVYGLLTCFIGAIYIVSVMMVISVIGGEIVFDQYLLLLLTTLLVAIIFNPLRHFLQRIIDGLFFPARENYRQAISEIKTDLDSVLSSEDLYQQLIISLTRFVPNRHIALFRIAGDTLDLQYSSRADTPEHFSFPGSNLSQLISSGQVHVLPKAVYLHPPQVNFSQSDFLNRINFSLCIPLSTKTTFFTGILCVTPYHDRFIAAELDLLHTGCVQAAEILDRLLLQERIIIEREEKKRLKEISSYIISLVAHELQSPLTSIRLFSELLQQKDALTGNERDEYLHIIENETIRLSRLIKNVLDFSRIERGIKEYHFELLTLNRILEHLLSVFQQQLEQNGFKLDIRLTEQDTTIRADEDAIISALGNLLANAIKYSPLEKYLAISTRVENQHVRLRIKDKGLGIADEEQKRVFDEFYRSGNKQVQSLSGLGLGLSLVKHIIIAHHGEITLDSKPGNGSTFTITLPLGVAHEKNTDH